MDPKPFNFPLFFTLCLLSLQFLDILLTWYGLKLGLSEANPLYGRIHNIPKIVLPIIIYLIYLFGIKHLVDPDKLIFEIVSVIVWIFVTVFYVAVISWNIYLILKVVK